MKWDDVPNPEDFLRDSREVLDADMPRYSDDPEDQFEGPSPTLNKIYILVRTILLLFYIISICQKTSHIYV